MKKQRDKRCLGIVDARAMICEHFLALGVENGNGGLNVTGGAFRSIPGSLGKSHSGASP